MCYAAIRCEYHYGKILRLLLYPDMGVSLKELIPLEIRQLYGWIQFMARDCLVECFMLWKYRSRIWMSLPIHWKFRNRTFDGGLLLRSPWKWQKRKRTIYLMVLTLFLLFTVPKHNKSGKMEIASCCGWKRKHSFSKLLWWEGLQ